jgi:hypothetical protein
MSQSNTSLEDRLARLEQAASGGEWWHPHKPEKGDGKPQPDKIAGEVLSRSTEHATSKDGKSYGEREVIRVMTADRKVWRFYEDGSVLKRLFKELDPRAGDLVFAAYHGKVSKKDDPSDFYHNWAMAVDKSSRDIGGTGSGITDSPEPVDESPEFEIAPVVTGDDVDDIPF